LVLELLRTDKESMAKIKHYYFAIFKDTCSLDTMG